MEHDQLYRVIQDLIDVENEYIKFKPIAIKKLEKTKGAYLKKRLDTLPIDEAISKILNIPDKISPHAKFYSVVADEPAVGVYFDDTVVFDEEMAITGMEFMQNGFMKPPFNTLAYCAKDYFGSGKDLSIWVKYFPETNKILFLPPAVENKLEYSFAIDADNMDVRVINVREAGWPEAQLSEKDQNEWNNLYKAFFHLCMVLNHPVYYTEINEIPERVNKKRERSGKARLSKYIKVKMHRKVKETLANADGSIRRPHWRRGHVRRLWDGRIIPVQACIVNFNGVNIPKKKNIHGQG